MLLRIVVSPIFHLFITLRYVAKYPYLSLNEALDVTSNIV